MNAIELMIAIINPCRNLINLTAGNSAWVKEIDMEMTIEDLHSDLTYSTDLRGMEAAFIM